MQKKTDWTKPRDQAWAVCEGSQAVSLEPTAQRTRIVAKHMSRVLTPRRFHTMPVTGPVVPEKVYTVVGGSAKESDGEEGGLGVASFFTQTLIMQRG